MLGIVIGLAFKPALAVAEQPYFSPHSAVNNGGARWPQGGTRDGRFGHIVAERLRETTRCAFHGGIFWQRSDRPRDALHRLAASALLRSSFRGFLGL